MPDDATSNEPNGVRLPAPSRQKAMDWSLVLASQDISHLIASPDESGKWSLQVGPLDVARAAGAIRQYEAENRPQPWQRQYFEGRIVFDWVALVWAVALAVIQALAEKHPGVEKAGVMHGMDVARGEWWRLVTATQLHADWGHLASNLCIGFGLLGLVMGRWGTATGMLAALLAGVGGNLANWALQPERFSLGASTVVMGCVGLLALLPRSPKATPQALWRGVFGGIAGAVLIFVLFGLDPSTDVLAHAGGFVAGLGLAAMLRAAPVRHHSRVAGVAAALLLATLILLTWALALRHAIGATGGGRDVTSAPRAHWQG
jgi:rhomboid protease GluP